MFTRDDSEITRIVLFSLIGYVIIKRNIFFGGYYDREPLRSYEHRLSRWYMKYAENRNIISRSLSFGLALASIGLLFMLGYVLIYYIFLA